MTNQEKLNQLHLMKNPSAATALAHAQILSNLLAQTKSTKGEKGDRGEKGEKGDRGDSIAGPRGLQGMTIKGPKGEKGDNGKDAVIPDIDKIAELASKKVKIPKSEKVIVPTLDEIVGQAVIELEKKKKKISIKDIHDLNDLISYLKAGGFRGGGSSTGGGFTKLTATGTRNGANLTFTFTQVPSEIVSDGIWLTPKDDNGGTQWSNVGNTITMVVPPISSIYGVA